MIEQFGHVDDPDAYERAQTLPALADAMDWLRPRNWHATGLTPDDILPVAVDCGIPVVWVPPTEVLIEVTAGSSKRSHWCPRQPPGRSAGPLRGARDTVSRSGATGVANAGRARPGGASSRSP